MRFNILFSFLFRYGDTWTPWRRCGVGGDVKEEMLELDASSEESISGITGYSYDHNGRTRSLGASTKAGRSWGPHGEHRPDRYNSLRNSPDANLRLRFLSGDQTVDKYILRWLPSYNQI